MKTFTVRQLDRETARVMEACDTYGEVKIRRRDGRTYTIKADQKTNSNFRDWLEDTRRRTKEIFGDVRPMTKKEMREFQKLLRSDRDI